MTKWSRKSFRKKGVAVVQNHGGQKNGEQQKKWGWQPNKGGRGGGKQKNTRIDESSRIQILSLLEQFRVSQDDGIFLYCVDGYLECVLCFSH